VVATDQETPTTVPTGTTASAGAEGRESAARIVKPIGKYLLNVFLKRSRKQRVLREPGIRSFSRKKTKSKKNKISKK
jgi:hypothetical protein